MMKEAMDTRASNVKTLNTKNAVKAETEDKLITAKELVKMTEKELHEIDLYLARLHVECDFLVRNFENRHEARIEEEVGLETAETIVTHGDPPTHKGTEEVYKEEHAARDVD